MKNRALYLSGTFINGFGDGIQQVTMMWYIYQLTGKASSIGLMIAIYYLPSMILTPFVSVYVDHRVSKKLVVITDFIRFLLVFIMAASIFLNMESAAIFYSLQFLLAVCYTVYKPASQAFIKESFTDIEIPFVISKASSLNEAALIAGTGISGVLLVKLSLTVSFLANALTFLIAALFFFYMKSVRVRETKNLKIVFIQELNSGWKFINLHEGMKYLLFLSILNSISIQMTTTIMLPLAMQFGGSSELYSFFEMAFAVGGILSGIVITYFLQQLERKIVLLTMGGMMTGAILLAVMNAPSLAVFSIFVIGLFTMGHLVTIQTLIQLNTPREFIGRVVGLRTILASFIKITSALATGFLISEIGIKMILMTFAGMMFLSLFTFRKMKKVQIPGATYE
ncbi:MULTISPECIES: MFS transporter [unclassified Bacillus (in: firmicutes)]|uniref:MFS transporter n=1 Tax=unclassified Bacillus (in: firmicutes) TaxID=185979 RepID=UPI0008F1EF39|nr:MULTISPECIES: MFS transporter [unclassified Bacillus (in: firmicutes)]SFA71504.1 Major Facilitator Superfamily protein [Bacillus sp. UNCCL13]SFQ61710.1 Major Facilitator Superfamily protein [Bacillus sp. cl95]